MSKFNCGQRAYVIFLLCLTTAIASSAQGFTTVYSFAGTDGSHPAAVLVQTTNGNLYGTTEFGGANGDYGSARNWRSYNSLPVEEELKIN